MSDKKYLNEELVEIELRDWFNNEYKEGMPVLEIINKIENLLRNMKSENLINGNELYNKIAGHSYYHGDKILSRISCMQEGKVIDKDIEPADVKQRTYTEFVMYLSHCVCKKCKTNFRFDRSDANTYLNLSNTKYCPKCGAEITNTFIFKR